MIKSSYSEEFPNNSVLCIDKDYKYGLLFSNNKCKEMMDMINVAPSARIIDYQTSNNPFLFEDYILNKQEFNDFAFRKDDIDSVEYRRLVKRCQALLVKIGLPVLEIYGVEINGYLYGLDLGFKIEFECVSIFVNFNLVRVNGYNRLATGYNVNLEQYIYQRERSCGHFESNIFMMKDYIPNNILKLFGEVPLSNIKVLPNLSISISNLWSNIDEDRIVIIDFEEKKISLSILFTDAITSANLIRSEGAEIFKNISTNPNLTSGYSNIATAKVLSADTVEALGDLVIVNTSNNQVIKSTAEFIEYRHRFLNVQWPSEQDQYHLAHSASTCVSLLGNLNIINDRNLENMIDSILSSQPSIEDNLDAHFILAEDGSVIGYLENESKIIYNSQTQIGGTKINDLIFIDNVLSKEEFKNIAAEFQDVEGIVKELEYEKEKYISLSKMINYDDIIANIKRIDKYVSNCFNSLSSLIASQELVSARAATYIRAAELILKMPLKTAYGAVEFGTLAEFIKINVQTDGSCRITRDDSGEEFIPHRTAIYQYQCSRDWCILNADPGIGFSNDVLIGSAYAQSVSDLQNNFLSTKTVSYVKTDRQTRGSGKSEQVVVPRTTLEPRIVMKFDDLLNQVISFLTTILNNDVVKANAQISLCVSSCVDATKRYAEMRKPYLDELLQDQEYKERIFSLNHFINLAKVRIPEELAVNSTDHSYVAESEVNSYLNNDIENTIVNSYLNLIDKRDLYYNSEEAISEAYAKREESKEALENFLSLLDSNNCIGTFEDSIPESEEMAIEIIENADLVVEIYMDYYSVDKYITDFLDLKMSHSINGTEKKRLYITKLEAEDENEDIVNSSESYERRMSQDLKDSIIEHVRILNQAYEDRLHHMTKLRSDFVSMMNKQEFCCLSDEIDFQHSDSRITLNDKARGNTVVFDVIKDESSFESDKTIKYTIRYNKSMSVIQLSEVKPVIYIGNLGYDIRTFLRQFEIYSAMPLSQAITDKIKYIVFRNTSVSDDDLVTRIAELVDKNTSISLAKYLSQHTDNINYKLVCIALCIIIEPIRSIAWLLAGQSDTLGIMLAERNVSMSAIGTIINDTSRVSK